MANRLRSKLSKLRHDGRISEEEYQDLIDKLDGRDKALLREVETLRRDVQELKELLGYIRKYGVASDSTPKHIGQRFCEIVDGWEEQDDEDSN
jgi:hypothetical protein